MSSAVEQAAASARQDLSIGVDGPVPDLLRLLEDEAGLRVFVVDLGSDGIDGAYQAADGVPYALINQDKGPERKRFTLAHEFGHHCLNHGAQIDENISFRDSRRQEQEANGFAAAFLMPRPAIDGWFAAHDDPNPDLETIVRLAFFFNVSAFVARYRLETIRRLTSPAAQRRIDEALNEKEHYDVASALNLVRSQDSIRAAGEAGGYVPVAMQRWIAELLNQRLLEPEAARERLRVGDPDTRLEHLAASLGLDRED